MSSSLSSFRLLCLAAACLLAAAATAVGALEVELLVTEPVVLQGQDAGLVLCVTGTPDGGLARVRASATAGRGTPRELEGHAQFDVLVPKGDGKRRCTPVGELAAGNGTYSGFSSTGLFWSAQLKKPQQQQQQQQQLVQEDVVEQAVAAAGFGEVWEVEAALASPSSFSSSSSSSSSSAAAAPKTVTVYPTGNLASVRSYTLKNSTVVGVLYVPMSPEKKKLPGAVVIGGSEGGIDFLGGLAMAGQGRVALALGYFGVPDSGLPPSLDNIPLEYFVSASKLVRSQPEVDASLPLTLVGTSRGGEAAIQVASLFPSAFDKVISVVGGPLRFGPSWTMGGKTLPNIPFGQECFEAAAAVEPKYQSRYIISCQLSSATPAQVAAALAPLEKSTADLMFIAGTDDLVWDSPGLLSRAAAILATSRPGQPARFLIGAGGHFQSASLYFPVSLATHVFNPHINQTLYFGGTPEGIAAGNRAYAEALPAFLAA